MSDEIIDGEKAAQRSQLKRENGLVRAILTGYEQARVQLLGMLTDRYTALGDDPTREQVQALAHDLAFLEAIEGRILQLQQELSSSLHDGLSVVANEAGEVTKQQITQLAASVGVVGFEGFGMNPDLEMAVAPAVQQIVGLMESTRVQLIASLREQLGMGERMSTIANALLSKNDSVFARGMTSAELLTRRAVVQANNYAKMQQMAVSKQYLPTLKKQVIAATDSRVTDVCKRVDRQIKNLDEPFVIEGDGQSFGRLQMHPPFHWNCRSTVVPYIEAKS